MPQRSLKSASRFQGGLTLRGIALLSFCLLAPACAVADITATVNEVRAQGCHGSEAASSAPLRQNARLDEAARRMSRGESLSRASQHVAYRATASTALHITNVPTDAAIERMLRGRACTQIADPSLRDIGIYRRGADLWLVAAAPFSPPRIADLARVERRVLELTNLARAHPRVCGNVSFPAAPALSLSTALQAAAMAHSVDMAQHDYLDHVGRDGSSPSDRVGRAGYRWKLVGENIASGVVTAEDAVNGWLASPHHCQNIMTRGFTNMAVGFAVNADSSGAIYWTQLLGAPGR